MPSQHKLKAFTFRPATEDDREWLVAYAEDTGQDVNAVLREALSEYRASRTGPEDQRAPDTELTGDGADEYVRSQRR